MAMQTTFSLTLFYPFKGTFNVVGAPDIAYAILELELEFVSQENTRRKP